MSTKTVNPMASGANGLWRSTAIIRTVWHSINVMMTSSNTPWNSDIPGWIWWVPPAIDMYTVSLVCGSIGNDRTACVYQWDTKYKLGLINIVVGNLLHFFNRCQSRFWVYSEKRAGPLSYLYISLLRLRPTSRFWSLDNRRIPSRKNSFHQPNFYSTAFHFQLQNQVLHTAYT